MSEPLTPSRTIPVRVGEHFDVAKVAAYLAVHMALPEESLEVSQFPSGASNLTYLLQAGHWKAVLRRPPLGPLPPKAHDMARESAFLTALQPVFPVAPKPYVYCADAEVIGAPFYVMSYTDGVVLDSHFPAGTDATPALCQAISHAVVDTLAQLHAVSPEAAGLQKFGHPDGFMRRQVTGWIERYERAKTDEHPQVARLTRWFSDNVPTLSDTTVIHNDYKLNNMLLSPTDLSTIVGVVDWEMSTVGDPLFDLAIALGYWVEPTDDPVFRELLPTITAQPGFLTREQMIQRYALKTGRDVSNMKFYLVFAYFKLAVILQQIYIRWKRGQTQDMRFSGFGVRVQHLLEHAESLL